VTYHHAILRAMAQARIDGLIRDARRWALASRLREWSDRGRREWSDRGRRRNARIPRPRRLD
jgi:hypothetical protein